MMLVEGVRFYISIYFDFFKYPEVYTLILPGFDLISYIVSQERVNIWDIGYSLCHNILLD